MSSLEKYFAEWDPMDFIKELDAPEDEYSAEAATIALRYQPSMNDTELGELVYDVFVESIELDHDSFRAECMERASQIRAILDKNKMVY